MLCKIIFCDHILHYRVNFAYNAEIYMDINSIRDVYGGVYGVQSCSIWHVENSQCIFDGGESAPPAGDINN